MREPIRISVLSKEYVKVQITAKEAGDEIDPTSDTVAVALVEDGRRPASGDFITGDWETVVDATGTSYWARLLVGPGGDVQKSAGTYDLWAKVTDNPEIPVLKAPGQVVIF